MLIASFSHHSPTQSVFDHMQSGRRTKAQILMDPFLKPPLLLQKIMLFHRKYDGKALESKMSFKELFIKGKSQNADSIENIF